MSAPSRVLSRRGLLRLAALAPAAAALLAACGGGGTATTGGSSAGSASLTAGSTAAASSSAASSSAVSSAAMASASGATTAASSSASTSAAMAAPSGPKPTPTPGSGETHKGASTTLNLWYGWGGATAIQTWDALGKKMGDALPNLNVKWLTADNNTKLLTAIAGGDPPNVAVGNAPYPEFWARGAAEPLDDLIAKSKVVTRQDIPDAYWSYASYKGKTFGVPAVEAFARYGLCLDMSNMKGQGIDPTNFSWDWDNLTQLQQQLTKTAANGSIQTLGIDPLDAMGGSFGGSNPFYWGLAWKLEYYDEASRTFHFDADQLVEGLTTLKKVYDIAGGAQKISGFHNSYGTWTESPTAAMPSGVEDMNINGYWAPGELAHSSPDRQFAYTWAPVPASEKGFKFQVLVGHNAFIPKGAKNAGDAFQLIEFLVGDTAEQTIFDGTGWLGARQSFLAKVDVSKYKGLDFYVNSTKQADKIYGMPSNPIESFCATQWGKAQQDVLYGKQEAKPALQQLQQQVTNELKQRFPNG